MSCHITNEQRDALQANPGEAVKLHDEKTGRVYLLVGEDAMPVFWEGYIQREVQRGLEAADRGEVEDWELESIKVEGQQLLQRDVAREP